MALLSLKYPRLFALSTILDGSIKDAWNSVSFDWDFLLRRPLGSIEPQQWEEIKHSLAQMKREAKILPSGN